MADRIGELRDRARRYHQQRDYRRAIETLGELRQLDPHNPRWARKLGEAYQRVDDDRSAVRWYEEAARLYAESQLPLKAIALCKVILGLAPSHRKTQQMLAQMVASDRLPGSQIPKRRGRPASVPLPADPMDPRRGVALPDDDGSLELVTGDHLALPPLSKRGIPLAPEPPAAFARPVVDPEPRSVSLPKLRAAPPAPASPAPPRAITPPSGKSGSMPSVDISPAALGLSPDQAKPAPPAAEPAAPAVVMPPVETSTAEVTAHGSAAVPVPPQMIPLGDSLDAIDLRQIMPAVREQAASEPGPGDGGLFEITIDDGDWADLERPAHPAPSSREILAQMPRTPLLSSLDQASLQLLIERVSVRQCDPDERIILQGSQGSSLFILVEGEVVIYREGRSRVELGRLHDGAFFGEIALITQTRRSATVQAVGECTLLEISRDVIRELISQHPGVLTVMLRFFRERVIDTLVDTHELFAPFAGEERQRLVERFAFIEAAPRCTLLTAGQEAAGLFVLLSGEALVLSPDGSPLATVGTGEIIGEISLLTGSLVSATVRTTTKCWLLRLDQDAFKRLTRTHPQFLEAVDQITAQRRAQVDPLVDQEPGSTEISLALEII